jgi:hypothetical protein
MNWLTEIRVKKEDELFVWAGPIIVADSFEEAVEFLYSNGLSGLTVIGELKEEVEQPCRN